MPYLAPTILSCAVPWNEENNKLLEALKIEARKNYWTMSRLILEALKEYWKRHDPGNPQLILQHWTPEKAPFPLTVQERCEHQFGLVEIPDLRGAKWSRCLKCGARP